MQDHTLLYLNGALFTQHYATSREQISPMIYSICSFCTSYIKCCLNNIVS